MDLTFTQQLQQFAANHPVMIVAWLALFAAVVFNFYKGATSKYKTILAGEAVALANDKDAVFIDLRSDDEFKAGHILNSHSIHPSDVKSGKTGSIDKFKDRPVIVVDGNGFSSNGIAEQLSKQGFAQVYVLKEGMIGWKSAHLPTVKKK